MLWLLSSLPAHNTGKKCLVLDIDYTLFDLNSSAEHPDELARPYLHEFLTACYEYYDIIIWSATNMKWVEVRVGAAQLIPYSSNTLQNPLPWARVSGFPLGPLCNVTLCYAHLQEIPVFAAGGSFQRAACIVHASCHS